MTRKYFQNLWHLAMQFCLAVRCANIFCLRWPLNIFFAFQTNSRLSHSQHHLLPGRDQGCHWVHWWIARDQVRLLPLLLQQLHLRLVDLDREHHHCSWSSHSARHHPGHWGQGSGDVESSQCWWSLRVQAEADSSVRAWCHHKKPGDPWD